MEQKQKYRTSIERKFFIAIFWVGIIPMTLTLIVAYVFAREGQWITTKRNLTTAVKITTEGVRLSLSTRLSYSAQIATEPIFSQFFHAPKEEQELLIKQISEKLFSIQSYSEGKSFAFAIVDKENNLLFSTPSFKAGDLLTSNWQKKIKYPYIVAISTPPQAERYSLTVAIPIKDKNDEILGFLLEVQEASELIRFALGQTFVDSPQKENIYYMIVYMRNSDGISVYYDDKGDGTKANINYEITDSRFTQRLKRISNKSEGLLTLLRFSSRGKVAPVLLAYEKIYPEYDIYFCAYKHLDEIFWFIHIGSVVSLIIAGLVILFFSLIGYRIIHKNILQPLSLINEGAQIIRQGDLELKLKIQTGDELEEVAISFNEMASALRKNIYELESSEERYRNLVNSMRDGIYQTNKEGVLTLINPFGARILGFDEPDSAIGTRIENLFLNTNDYKTFCSELEKNNYLNQFRVWIKPIRGELICVEISAGYLKDEKSNIIGIEGIFRDITQNVLLEKEVHERA
ncbi:MAG: PAS domain S-box protein, partial [Candidatus Hydrogenedens sp.]